MSVWLQGASAQPLLHGSEGVLLSVSIHVQPHDLEDLLEALSRLDFPINPQIYHEAALLRRYSDGREERDPVTVVEFPAYEVRLDEVRRTVVAYGFPAESVHAAAMLDEIHAEPLWEPAAPGASYVAQALRKRAEVAIAGL